MRFLFRCDSGIEIGTGHVMRCLTLANALRDNGHQCVFVCREHYKNIDNKIEQQGFLLFRLPQESNYKEKSDLNQYQKWLGCSQNDDAQAVIKAVSFEKFDWIIVDHYGIDEAWEKLLRPYCKKMMVIDDLANRFHDCDLLLDQSVLLEKKDYTHLIKKEFIFLGAGNILFRDEFSDIDNNFDKNRDLFICLGGTDQKNLSLQILKATLECYRQNPKKNEIKISVVVGSSYVHLSEIESYIQSQPEDIKLMVDISNMAEFMSQHRVAIVSCGTMVLESCVLGIPSVGVAIADNQRSTAIYLSDKGYIFYLDLFSSALVSQIKAFNIFDSLKLSKPFPEMCKSAKSFFNLNTAQMIVSELSCDNRK